MTHAIDVVGGNPTAEQAAAILAAVQVMLESHTETGPEHPWPYRSAWRQAAIDEGVRLPYAASITALGRPMRRPSGTSNDLGDWGADVS